MSPHLNLNVGEVSSRQSPRLSNGTSPYVLRDIYMPEEKQAMPARLFFLIPVILFMAVLPARATDPPATATITGEPGGENDTFGWAVSSFGDVNGDDVPDLFIGAPTNDTVAGFAGRAYLFYGPVLTNRTAASADGKITAQVFG